jgi:tetratricopeptide (TPR) repeat protein
VLILHVRQCEVALADGRLDEAYELAVARDVGRHRRGQRLITRLLKALVQRGQEHLHAGRHAAALADCEKAAKIGGNLPDVVALRAAAADAIAQAQRSEQRQARVLATARRHVDDGCLDLGEQALAEASPDATRVVLLRDDIARRRRTAGDAARACRQALQLGEIETAARELVKARAADPDHVEVAELARSLEAALRDRLEDAISAGQLDRAGGLLEHLRAVDPDGSRTRQHQAVLDRLREAWQQVRDGAYGEATITVARVLPLTEGAPWLKQVAEQLRQADHAIAELKIGPLAWLGQAAITTRPATPATPATLVRPKPDPIPWHAPMKTPSDDLPPQFLLQADGIGSFLVLRQPVVTIGPISAPVPADLALVAEPTLGRVSIARVDDDYFLKTSGAAAGRLLTSGERLELSPRCRLTFVLPSAASTSAALDLSGARLPRADVRRVILMDQDLIIGPGGASHVVARGLDHPVVLHLSRGQLVCAGRDPVVIDGRPVDVGAPLPLNASIQIGGVSFVLTRPDSIGSRGMTC